jgi:antitoxin (DNA-binding transcriptional repressor) of toxin-antitoxin stability system
VTSGPDLVGPGLKEISIRELRNHGGDMVDRVAHGERLTVTRDGKPVADRRPSDAPT